MPTPDKQLSAEQSSQIAETIREEIAGRRISRQALAELAKLSLSILEKALGGRRPFTLATTVRLEQAVGVSLRKAESAVAPAMVAINGDVAADNLGAYSRRAVTRLEGNYLTLRPSFGDQTGSCLGFRESERLDADYGQFGEVAVPNRSGFIYLVTNEHGQYRVITVSRSTRLGEMYGIITTLLAGRGSQLAPIAAPIVLLPIKSIERPTVGRISAADANYAVYREHLRRTIDEPLLYSYGTDSGAEDQHIPRDV